VTKSRRRWGKACGMYWGEERCIQGFDDEMIYFLTAIGLSPGGSTHLQTNNI
jgi:hypothetical protein